MPTITVTRIFRMIQKLPYAPYLIALAYESSLAFLVNLVMCLKI